LACRRYAALWAYGTRESVTITAEADATIAYVHGDRTLAFHSCRVCGCTTHWAGLAPHDGEWRIAVNMRMADPAAFADIPVARFDGAVTWSHLD